MGYKELYFSVKPAPFLDLIETVASSNSQLEAAYAVLATNSSVDSDWRIRIASKLPELWHCYAVMCGGKKEIRKRKEWVGLVVGGREG